jgi:hypothetical protein
MSRSLLDAGVTFSNDEIVSGGPAFRIAAENIRFVNTERGRITASVAGKAAIEIDAAGATIVNELGGIIRGFDSDTWLRELSIRGSESADTIDNAGLIVGPVALMGGNDTYIYRTSGPSVTGVTVDLGSGDDRFVLRSGNSQQYHFHALEGGSGSDTLELDGPIGVFDGSRVTGFERLEVGENISNLQNFSNFSEVVFTSTGFVNFIGSRNPLVDLQLVGNYLTIGGGSVIRNVTGSAAADSFELFSGTVGGATLLGSADLGDGDDQFRLTIFGSGTLVPVIGGTVNGGAGNDSVSLSSEAGLTIDLSKLVGFERINTGTFSSATSTVRLTNLNNYLEVTGDGEGGTLTIAESTSPNAAANVSSKGILVLEETATIGRYGFPTGPGWEQDFDQVQQGDDRFNVTVINRGTIIGPVQLYYGDDFYDGRLGITGGTIFGYAGNDRLYGGVADDRIDGGFGGDDLFGGNGNDVLIGGGGGDRLDAGSGNDTLDGGPGNDTLLGESGSDTASFSGVRTDYIVQRTGDTVTVRDLRATGDGTDTLTGIEQLQFSDGLVGLIPEELVLFLPGTRDLIAWDSTQGSNGFSYFLRLGAGTEVAAVGDFTGDGRSDMLLSQPGGGLVRWDVSRGGNGFAVLPAAPGFEVIGQGDLRGNGATDLLLKNAAGQLRILDAAAGTISDLFGLAPGWSVRGVGNINGTGKDDVVLQNDASGAVIAFTDQGWRDLITLAPGSGWEIAGLGDVTGGLADDFIFRNANSGVTIFWDTTQGNAGFKDFATIGPAWDLLTIKDLNGDSREDIVFQNDNGLAVYWTGTNWVDLGATLIGTELVGTGVFP